MYATVKLFNAYNYVATKNSLKCNKNILNDKM